MRTVPAAGHGHSHPVHVRHGARHARRMLRAPRAIAPEALALFSDRMDDAQDYASTVRDFVLVHDLTHSADDFDS